MTDNRNWMQRLPAEMRRKPLAELYIPGSHEAATHFLNIKMPVACDLPRLVRLLNIPPVRKLIYRWSRCQSLSLTEQFCHGIRYFDIRVACNRRSRYAFTVHGLYGYRVEDMVEEVLQFLDANPDEVVIMDFNHFYNFSRLDHTALVEVLIEKFGCKLVPSPPFVSMKQLNLEYINAMSHQVIIFYQDETFSVTHPLIWSRTYISSPWANTNSLKKMLAYIETALHSKEQLLPEGGFFVTQGILTPTFWDIVKHCRSNLRDRMALRACSATLDWLMCAEVRLKGLLNIIMVDFVEFAHFCDRVVQLNFRPPNQP